MPTGEPNPSRKRQLADYRSHYRADAAAIQDPQALHPVRQASENRRLETLVRLLDIGQGQRLLDIGCGSGWLADRCQRQGAVVNGMDIALLGVAAARRRFPGVGAYEVGDIYYLPFADGSFDGVILSEVVEHLEDIDGALAEVVRVLAKGGKLLVSVPYRETIVEHLCIHCNHLTPANAHLHAFDQDKLAALLRAQGLQPQKTVLMSNKGLEVIGFPQWSRQWPYWAWRGVDHLCNRIVGKQSYLCILAVAP